MNSPVKSDKRTVILPVLLIAIGTGWLLTSIGVMPGIDWVWILSLGVFGILAFLLSGFDKVSVVVGPFFILTSFLSILRQPGRLSMDVEVPILVIVVGVLLLIARSSAVPAPRWLLDAVKSPSGD